ncbi:MAG: hypothetical protein Q9191_007070 [Dirinaria sp. TL-2023a]
MGLPLQLFGKGALFGPYTPLQQLDMLADHGTKSYIVGSTNSLLLQQKDRYSDILINLDDTSVIITSTSLRTALSLSAADRRWIDFLSQTVADTWDEKNPSRPISMGYMGSEDFIRLQFEEYLLALLSSIKYHVYLTSSTQRPPLATIEGDPVQDFNIEWIHVWRRSSSFNLFDTHTDSHLFDIVEPRHPTAGNLSFEDIQRRLTQQIQTLHLDDRFATSKEAFNRRFATGQKKVSAAVNNLWAEIEAVREAQQRKRAEAATRPTTPQSLAESENSKPRVGPDMAAAQASVAAAGQKAGAYLSSWGTWAADKRKGWGRTSSSPDVKNPSVSTSKLSQRGWDSAVRSPNKKVETGGDGIGRLDA